MEHGEQHWKSLSWQSSCSYVCHIYHRSDQLPVDKVILISNPDSFFFETLLILVRVYLQDTNLDIYEKAYDTPGWSNGSLRFGSPIPCTALAATSFLSASSNVAIRLYYSSSDDSLLEKGWDGIFWYDGAFSVNSTLASYVASISWDSVQIRVYFQKGVNVSAVSEQAWGEWSVGQAALPRDP